eukprot:NODE_17_length_48642_cov_1.199349.p4 type:complete len:656 gc:universal NODE_17_length_48642_cov_1.199349:11652-13619(+)
MILLIDHFDSYTYNIIGLCHLLNVETKVTQCVKISQHNLDFKIFDGVIISPGYGHPNSCQCRFILELGIPILGICLGFQLICMHFGLEIVTFQDCKHGTIAPISLNDHGEKSRIYKDIPKKFNSVVYNSLHAVGYSDNMRPLAFSNDILMAVEVKRKEIFGVQYHPESILSEFGIQLFKNFFSICRIHVKESLTKLKTIQNFELKSLGLYKIRHNNKIEDLAFSLFESDYSNDLGLFISPWDQKSYFLAKLSNCILFSYNYGNLTIKFERKLFNSHSSILNLMCRGTSAKQIDEEVTIKVQNIDLFRFISNLTEVMPIYSKLILLIDYEIKEFCLENYTSNEHGNCTLFLAMEYQIVDNQHMYSTQNFQQMPQIIDFSCNNNHGITFESMSKAEYIKKVELCQNFIRQGESYELNFTVPCTSKFNKSDNTELFRVFKCMYLRNPAPYSVFFNLETTCVFCLSPEKFIDIVEDTVTMKPIKGTMARSGNNDAQEISNLKNSSKDVSENLMIVDLIRNDLTKICIPNSVYCPKLMEIESFSSVHQMVSTVCGIQQTTIGEILKHVFPPGSMTGSPKKRTVEILDKLESSRGLYSGTIGIMQPENCSFNVVIRTAILDKKKSTLTVGAGGAITIQSDPEMEYLEMLLKAKSVFDTICN